MSSDQVITVTKKPSSASVVDQRSTSVTATAQGPRGPQGVPGVYVGPTPPSDTTLVWVDTSGL